MEALEKKAEGPEGKGAFQSSGETEFLQLCIVCFCFWHLLSSHWHWGLSCPGSPASPFPGWTKVDCADSHQVGQRLLKLGPAG